MNPDQLARWRRIEAHSFDDAFDASPFSLRLAKENGWSLAHAERAILEYRRFVFLAVVAAHPVSPSPAVDAVWHLHLLYTRDYWDVFCPQILGTTLHHGPSRGGAQERDKFAEWYARTRASYRQFFGEPPADLWPAPSPPSRMIHVDVDRSWVIPKPAAWAFVQRTAARLSGFWARARTCAAWLRARAGRVSGATGLVAMLWLGWPARADAAATTAWPFNLRGEEFLLFFMIFAAVLIPVAIVLRWILRGAGRVSVEATLDPYEAAYLSGGRAQVFHAALASVCQRGLAALNSHRINRTPAPLPPGLPLVERAICQAAANGGATLRAGRRAARDTVDAIERGLVERGLVLGGAVRWLATLVPLSLAVLVPGVGIQKILIGLSLNKPISNLVLLTAATAAGTLFFASPPRLTRGGSKLLQRLLAQHRSLERLDSGQLERNDASLLVPLAVALFGVTALRGTPLNELADELLPRNTGGGSSDADSSSDGGGSGGGDGGGGCGGCSGGSSD